MSEEESEQKGDHTMKDEKNIELTKEQLGDVSGSAGMKGDKGGKDTEMARCPHCGAANNVPAKDGASVTCSNCGKDFHRSDTGVH